MGTGAKIAIGCVAVLVLGGIVTVVAIVGGAYWIKGKADTFTAEQKQIEDLEKRAEAIPYTAPDDGVIREDRLVKFLEVRKQMQPTYEKYRTSFESLEKAGKKKEGDFNDLKHGLSALAGINDLRRALAQAQADNGMSRDEYRYMVAAIYKTAWASEIQKNNSGRTNAQITEDAMKQAARAMDEQARQTPDPNLPPEAQRAWKDAQEKAREARDKLQSETQEAVESAGNLDVPPQNVALFKKYEAEIKKYAMSGLEAIGL